jgi:hypothetical protein
MKAHNWSRKSLNFVECLDCGLVAPEKIQWDPGYKDCSGIKAEKLKVHYRFMDHEEPKVLDFLGWGLDSDEGSGVYTALVLWDPEKKCVTLGYPGKRYTFPDGPPPLPQVFNLIPQSP